MKQKGIAPIIGLVVIIAIALLLLVPGIGQSLMSAISGETQHCSLTPYDPNCLCTSNENKVTVRWSNYYCELSDLSLDPDDPNFESNAIAYAQDFLVMQYPTCNTLYDCPTPINVQVSEYGVPGAESRIVEVMCREYCDVNDNVATWWVLLIDLETGIASGGECYDYIDRWCI